MCPRVICVSYQSLKAWWDCAIWIRSSTRRLCVDLITPPESGGLSLYSTIFDWSPTPFLSVFEPHEDSKIIDSYRELCISTNTSVHLGAIISWSPGYHITHSKEIAFVPGLEVYNSGWWVGRTKSLVVKNGWTRGPIFCHIGFQDVLLATRGWLVQANHIFARLGMASNRDDCIFVYGIRYEFIISATPNNIPPGYLFLCPLADLQSESPPRFRRPECPAYWSLCPSGAESLSLKEAEKLGFPPFELYMRVDGWCWDKSVYTGIRHIHQAKGHDPYSQDAAVQLGYQPFQLSELDGPIAYVQETTIYNENFKVNEVPSNKCAREDFHEESARSAPMFPNSTTGFADSGPSRPPLRTPISPFSPAHHHLPASANNASSSDI
ncbi:hypothetical protein B0H11DRAFT_2195789 [Mycena galericulata]|nr:hypothetical protein B0H11DRAFT_2195789 [Mycena galericulata]